MRALRFLATFTPDRAPNLFNAFECADHRVIRGSMLLPIAPSNGPQETPKHGDTSTAPVEPVDVAAAFDDGTLSLSTLKG